MRQVFGLLIVAIIVAGSTASAIERGTVELGLDASISYGEVNGHYLVRTQAPSQFRFGWYLGERIAMDFGIGTASISTVGEKASATSLTYGVLGHFAKIGQHLYPFARVLLAMDIQGGNGTKSQLGIGGSVGVKGHGHFLNPQAAFSVIQMVRNDAFSSMTMIQLNLGLAFFSK